MAVTLKQQNITKAWAEDSANVEAFTSTKTGEGIVYQSKAVSAQLNGALKDVYEAAKIAQRVVAYWFPDIDYPAGSIVCMRTWFLELQNSLSLRWFLALKDNKGVQPAKGTTTPFIAQYSNDETGQQVEFSSANCSLPVLDLMLDSDAGSVDTTGTWMQISNQVILQALSQSAYDTLVETNPTLVNRADIIFLIGDSL